MQTTQWGPEGWILFHVLPFYYANINPKLKQSKLFKEFYVNLKDVLPCIYCRQSYKKFLEELPIEKSLGGFMPLFKWTYKIHNLVNKKLRDQGYLETPDPTLEEALDRFKNFYIPPNLYNRRWHMDPKKWLNPTLNFIATIVFNYDEKEPEKINGYKTLFRVLPHLIPGIEMTVLKEVLKQNPITKALTSQEEMIKWYYVIVTELIRGLGKDPHNVYDLMDLGLDPIYQSFDSYNEKFENRRAKCKQKSCRILDKPKLI
jgi:hypothetical protein